MLFPEDAPFGFILSKLRSEIETAGTAPISPLPCDRWIARSCLQKAIRRSEPKLAQRALANLFEHDRRAVWRHLAIIALEDVGIANIDALARIVAAYSDRRWREAAGGEWVVLCELTRQLAASNHCQVACDLLLRVQHDPEFDCVQADALEAGRATLVEKMTDRSQPFKCRAIAVLAMGGCLADGQRIRDPHGTFDVLSEMDHFSHIVGTCRSAWKICRNPMALLLPIVWQEWERDRRGTVRDDPLPPAHIVRDVPGYALDQFTRKGNEISRCYLTEDERLRGMLESAGVPKSAFARTLGDVLFLIEGGMCRRRLLWSESDRFRQPARWLPAVPALGSYLAEIRRHCEAKAREIAKVRSRLYHP